MSNSLNNPPLPAMNDLLITESNLLLKQYCTLKQKAILEDKVSYVKVRKNHLVFTENEVASQIFFVIDGGIALWKEGVNHRQIIRFVQNGKLFGYRGAIIEKTNYQLSASAVVDSKLGCIDKDIFLTILEENPELRLNILLNYVKELHIVEQRLLNFREMNIRQKVAGAIILVIDTFGIDTDNFLRLPLSRKSIAEIAGISKDRVIKQICKFRDEKILTCSGNNIAILNINALKEIIHFINFQII